MTKSKNKQAPDPPKLPTMITAKSDVLRRAEFSVETSTDGGRFTPEEYEAFQAAGWDWKKLLREAGRMTTIRNHQRNASTKAKREGAESRLAEIQQSLNTRGPKIDEEIQTLQAEIRNAFVPQ